MLRPPHDLSRTKCAGIFVTALATVSCSAFEGLTLVGSREAGSAIAPDGGCVHAEPPPSSMLGAPLGETEFVVAMSLTDLGDAPDSGSPAYASFGYDLDDVCSTRDAGSSCIEPSWASANHADGPGGRDNAVGMGLYNLNAPGLEPATEFANSSNATGILELAIRVRNYNQIRVDGVVDVALLGVGLPDGSVPRWDGTDGFEAYTPWLEPPDDGEAPSLDRPRYEDKNAYVTNAGGEDGAPVLVARFDNVFLGANPSFPMSQLIMTAEIVKSETGTWSLRNGTFAGRISIDDLLHTLAFVRDEVTHDYYCRGSGSYESAKAVTCALADISLCGPDDGSQPCDAASWAWQFQTTAIQLVGVLQPPPGMVLDDCPTGQSPADDRCSNDGTPSCATPIPTP